VSVLTFVARHPFTPPGVLARLARRRGKDLLDLGVLYAVAENPSTPAATLEWLATTGNVHIRGLVAAHRSLTRPVLERLAGDPETHVRLCVADRNDIDDDIRIMIALAGSWLPAQDA
jgi:hypothetical protein